MSALSGILAYGFSQLNGHGNGPAWWGLHHVSRATGHTTVDPGIAGWRWIFILQGSLTCAIAVAAYVVVVGFPDAVKNTCGFRLSKAEAEFVIARIELDRKDATVEA
jgi:hypothetical protein